MWLLRQVSVQEQARAMLQCGATHAALRLADAAGASWAPIVAAEAAFLLIHGESLSRRHRCPCLTCLRV